MYRAKIGAVMDVRGIGIAGEDIGDKSKQCFSKPVTVDVKRGAKDKNRACDGNDQ